jgi:putative transposase
MHTHRNGYRERYLLIFLGLLKLRVPRDREGEYQPEFCVLRPDCFERYKRVQREVDEGIKDMYLRGVSTRKVGEVLDALCGERVSAGYVSKVTKALDKEVAAFRNSPIEDDFVFLFLVHREWFTMNGRLKLKGSPGVEGEAVLGFGSLWDQG